MRHNGRSDYPKDEAEALILHENIQATKSCWECPNRSQCLWAVELLKKNIELKKMMRAEINLAKAAKNKEEKDSERK